MFFFITTNCGYEPIYSKNSNTNKELSYISVKNIKDRPGQILRNSLLNKFNPDRERIITKYNLVVEIKENKSDLAYRKDMSSTRTDLQTTANYLLIDKKSGKTLFDESVSRTTSFDVVESIYATLVAQKSAREKNLSFISDDIVTNLVVFFKNK